MIAVASYFLGEVTVALACFKKQLLLYSDANADAHDHISINVLRTSKSFNSN